MIRYCAAAGVFFCLLAEPAQAQEDVDPAKLLDAANQWIDENIDDSVLDALGVDKDRTRKFLGELQKSFQGEYVVDAAALRETATQLVPVMRQFEETEPYAIWLQSHLDYFEAAERLRKQLPTNNVSSRPKPGPKAERSVWMEMVDRRPLARAPADTVAKLKQIFQEEGVPPQLVWVAEVESSFNPRARSPVGAAGMFQLMPVTARTLDLSVGLLRDDRLNPEKSGRAAARYLKHLHARFGDWRLALAAYNVGESRVADLLKKHKTKTFDGIASSLPTETQMFVPKVEAVIRKREGRGLPELGQTPNGISSLRYSSLGPASDSAPLRWRISLASSRIPAIESCVA